MRIRMKTVTVEIDLNNDPIAIMKRSWNALTDIKLSVSNREGKKVAFPAIYGVAFTSLFPAVSLATMYALVNSELKISIEKES